MCACIECERGQAVSVCVLITMLNMRIEPWFKCQGTKKASFRGFAANAVELFCA